MAITKFLSYKHYQGVKGQMKPQILVATSKGLIVLTARDNSYLISDIHFAGFPISFVYSDPRDATWWVGISHKHWGEKLHQSSDFGMSWQELKVPSYGNSEYRPGKPALLRKIWVMQHAGVDKPNCFWMGTEPGALFFSADNGQTITLNDGLWNHASRMDDQQWFGTGKDFPFLHTIAIDPRNSDHLYVGVSCAGVFETMDSGKNWEPRNAGLKATYLPNSKSTIGHDPHQLLICPAHPDVIWQQNHCGIYRSSDGGKMWSEVSGEDGFPYYGFALAIDEEDPNTAWVIPAKSDTARIPANLRLEVYKTSDAGASWRSTSSGLPAKNAFDIVLRQAFSKKGSVLVFGTNNGNLYLSTDYGESWEPISQNLAAVQAVCFT